MELISLDLQIERTLRRLRKERRDRIPTIADGVNQNVENQEQGSLRDYSGPVNNDNYSKIRCQTINANKFELKTALIQQNPYGGLAHKEPNVHLAIFLEICDRVKMNEVTEDIIWMRLFPFSLRDKA